MASGWGAYGAERRGRSQKAASCRTRTRAARSPQRCVSFLGIWPSAEGHSRCQKSQSLCGFFKLQLRKMGRLCNLPWIALKNFGFCVQDCSLCCWIRKFTEPLLILCTCSIEVGEVMKVTCGEFWDEDVSEDWQAFMLKNFPADIWSSSTVLLAKLKICDSKICFALRWH